MKLAVFTVNTNAYGPQRLFTEGQKMGIEVTLISYFDLCFAINTNQTQVFNQNQPLGSFDLAVFRGGTCMEFSPHRNFLMRYLENKGTFVLNSASCQQWQDFDKLTQHFIFSENNLPIVPTEAWGGKKALKTSLNLNIDPVIIKATDGSMGLQVFKVTETAEIDNILLKHKANGLLKQPFLKTGHDLRIIIVGNKAIGAMRRIARSGAFLTNYSAGGLVENYSLANDPEAEKIALAVAKACLTDYAGIDLMQDESGQWLILEINRDCQFEGFEESTKLNVAREILNYMVGRVKSKGVNKN